METVTETLRLLPKALIVASLFIGPLMAIETVRAGDAHIIEGTYKKSSGAGLVLVVSLQRAR